MQEKKLAIITLKPNLRDILDRNPDLVNYIDILPNGTNIIFKQSKIPQKHRQRYAKLYRQATLAIRPVGEKTEIPIDLLHSFLKPDQLRAFQVTGKEARQESLLQVYELNFLNSEMLPWLQRNIRYMPNIKIIKFHIYYTRPAELTRFFQIVNTGNFQLDQFYFVYDAEENFGNSPLQSELLDYFFANFCSHLQQLEILSQNLWNINIALNNLKTLAIDFSMHPETLSPRAFVINKIPKLESIKMEFLSTDFLEFFFQSCIHQNIRLKTFSIEDLYDNLDNKQNLGKLIDLYSQSLCSRLQNITIVWNQYDPQYNISKGNLFNPLLTNVLESLSIDLLTAIQLEHIGKTCRSLKTLKLGSVKYQDLKLTKSLDFRNFLQKYKLKNLTTLSLVLDPESIKYHFQVHQAFPKLETLSIRLDSIIDPRDVDWLYQTFFQCNLVNLSININDFFSIELVELLQKQEKLSKFELLGPKLNYTNFVTLFNILIKFTAIKYIFLMVDFLELDIIASYLTMIPKLESICIYSATAELQNIDLVINCMHNFLKIFRLLNFQMPNLVNLQLVMYCDTKTTTLIPNLETIYLPFLKKNCPKLEKLELGYGLIKL